jgi:hypothetical protein
LKAARRRGSYADCWTRRQQVENALGPSTSVQLLDEVHGFHRFLFAQNLDELSQLVPNATHGNLLLEQE